MSDRTKWTEDLMGDQSRRVAVVTGANAGIGWETARALAERGARVVMACRSEERGGEALRRLQGRVPGGRAELRVLDLADLDQVALFVRRFREDYDRLDLLINNAGVMIPPASTTKQGYELQIGVNHLGHFALTMGLLPLLDATPGSRVVTVSSMAHRQGTIHFDDLDFRTRGYRPAAAYSQSKLANLLFTAELQRRLEEAGSGTIAVAAHPGWTGTDLQRHSRLFQFLNHIFAMRPPQGAAPTLRAATDPDAKGNDYYGPDGFLEARGWPVRVGRTAAARNMDDARRLWEVSEERTGIRFPLGTPVEADAAPKVARAPSPDRFRSGAGAGS